MRAPGNRTVGSGFGVRGSGFGAPGSGQARLPLDQRGGQAVVEYLIIAVAVIAAVMAVREAVQLKAQAVMNQALNSIPTQ